MAKKKTPEHIQDLLKQIIDHFDKEDISVRTRQIRNYKKLKYYWDGFYNIYWSETAHDWRVFDQNSANDESSEGAYYDKPVNVFRAYLEAIVAALSISVPSIRCTPDDADNDLDIATAKAGDQIADLIYKHNDVVLLWLHALFIHCTEGMVACYNYSKEDESFGTYSENEYEDVEDEKDVKTCPLCKNKIADVEASSSSSQINQEDELEDEFDPKNVEIEDLLQNGEICTNCMSAVIPEITKEKFTVSRLIGVTSKPKSRQVLEVYGGLFVKIPTYARTQAECPYLKYSYEKHYSLVMAEYPDLKDDITSNNKIRSNYGGVYDPYERWGRISTQYFGEYPLNLSTCNLWWLRPAAFEVLNDEDDIRELKKLYPNGCKVDLVNDIFAAACDEKLDDHWTLTQDAMADHVIHDPIGNLLTSIQDITNDLVSLTLQTIEHGVPQTFVDPTVLNFDAYRKSEVRPGDLFPAIAKSGKALSDGFYEVKTATLSQEVMPFGDKVQELGQLVVGALPSLFGGAAPGGSKTAAQYSMSRAQALQRLQTPWKMFTIWWKIIFSKVIPAYIKTVQQDERLVKKDPYGKFINIYIKKAELEGKIGDIELEASEQLPITWAQKKDVMMQLMQAGNPLLMQALSAPENIELLKQALGLTEFEIPGDDDRQKQYEEIRLLVTSEPIPSPAQASGDLTAASQDSEQPSVSVDIDVDNHAVEAEICRYWLVGDAGRLAKTENETGYRNVLLHMKEHITAMQQKAASQPPPQAPEGSDKPLAVKPSRQGAASGA